MTVADLTEDQKEEIYQLFFCGRSIVQWSDGTGIKRYDNSIQTISDKVGISKFVVSAFIDKCFIMRRELSIPQNCQISNNKKEMTLTYKSRMNYDL